MEGTGASFRRHMRLRGMEKRMEGTGASFRRHMRLRGMENAWKELELPSDDTLGFAVDALGFAARGKVGIAEEEKKC